MNAFSLRTVSLMLLATAVAASAFAEVFVRPMVGKADPGSDDSGSATMVGVSGGYRWTGSESTFGVEVGVDVAQVEWTHDRTAYGTTFRVKEKFLPVLLSLRLQYSLGETLRNVRLYAGPCAGFSRSSGSVAAGSGAFQKAETDDWSFCYGGSVGAVLPLTRSLDLDLGFRALRRDGPVLDSGNVISLIEDSTATVWYVGLGYTF